MDALDSGRFAFVLLGDDGRIVELNRSACELLGGRRSEVIGRAFGELVDRADRGWCEAQLTALLVGEVEHVREGLRLVGVDGREAWAELNVHRAALRGHDAVRAVAMLDQDDDRRLREQELERLAYSDPLTGLFNRRRFATELARHLASGLRYGVRGALLLIDVDGLKMINDGLGHLAGDLAITATAELMREHLRSTDVIARFGGDEFAVLLPAADSDQAVGVADALLDAARATSPPTLGRPLSLSIGIATIADPTVDAGTLFERADLALYESKRRGGDRYAIEDAARSGALPAPARTPLAVAREQDDQEIDLRRLLATVAELGEASLGLVSWELGCDKQAVVPAWTAALAAGMLTRARYDVRDQEWLYRLTDAGEIRLTALERDARAEPDGPASECANGG